MAQPLNTETRMSAEAFMAWADLQPKERRYELLDGSVFEMQSERAIHGRAKGRIFTAFARQIAELGLSSETFTDGMAVRVDDDTIFQPDALLRCGQPLQDDTILVTDPMIVVEVTSPSTQRIDALQKLTRYFRNPAIVHYLMVIPAKKTVFHHQRMASGQIVTRSFEQGDIRFDPPGVELDLAEVWGKR